MWCNIMAHWLMDWINSCSWPTKCVVCTTTFVTVRRHCVKLSISNELWHVMIVGGLLSWNTHKMLALLQQNCKDVALFEMKAMKHSQCKILLQHLSANQFISYSLAKRTHCSAKSHSCTQWLLHVSIKLANSFWTSLGISQWFFVHFIKRCKTVSDNRATTQGNVSSNSWVQKQTTVHQSLVNMQPNNIAPKEWQSQIISAVHLTIDPCFAIENATRPRLATRDSSEFQIIQTVTFILLFWLSPATMLMDSILTWSD